MIKRLRTWGGMLTVVVGALLVLFGVLPGLLLPTSEPLLYWVADSDWGWLNGLALIMTVLTPLALAALYSGQVDEAGWLGLAGFATAFVGSVLFACVQFDEAFLWPILAKSAPEFLNPTGPMLSDPGFSTIYLLMGVLYIVGFVLFGVATFRGGVFPRFAALLLIVGIPLFAGGMFLPYFLRAAGSLLAGAGLIWMGLNMSRPSRQASLQPAS
jgi:hypothetical protein